MRVGRLFLGTLRYAKSSTNRIAYLAQRTDGMTSRMQALETLGLPQVVRNYRASYLSTVLDGFEAFGQGICDLFTDVIDYAKTFSFLSDIIEELDIEKLFK